MVRVNFFLVLLVLLTGVVGRAGQLEDGAREIDPAGWYRSAWFGDFALVSGGWVFHAEHGFLFTVEAGAGACWVYDEEMGWFWLSEGSYPDVYSHEVAGWLFYGGVEDGERSFYDYSAGVWTTAAGIAGGSGVSGETYFAYLPSRSNRSLKVVRGVENRGKLNLELVEERKLGVSGATIAEHPGRDVLYVADAFAAGGARVELGSDGRVSGVEGVNFPRSYAYLSVDRGSRFLLGANYSEGAVDVFSLSSDGQVGGRVGGLAEGRVSAHCVLTSPDNDFVYIPYVKESNALWQYEFDGNSGALGAIDPKAAEVPSVGGPRHMVYHPSRDLVYFSLEQGVGVAVYAMAGNGQLDLLETVGALGDVNGVTGSDIAMTPDGKFLYVGIRGDMRDVDGIARYAIESDGGVRHLGNTDADKIPWGFSMTPDGRYLFVTATDGGTLTAYRVESNGGLSEAGSFGIGQGVTDLVTR